ncbi:MAG TPA: hypothetical protein VFQ53_04970 [Kofleriaceae bacterium]|nr:hypothetical protein [Kofleriaceae bacterium]
MLRLSRPRRDRPLWIVLGAIAAVLVLVQLVAQPVPWPVMGLVIVGVVGVPLVFGLLGRLWGWIALAAALGLGLGLVPLFGVLGLELSLAAALFAAIMGADVGSGLARTLAAMPAEGVSRAAYAGRTLARGALTSAWLAVRIMLIPAVIAALRGIVVPTCDWGFGIASYLALPLATAALAGAIGHAMGVLVQRRVLGAFAAQLPALVVAALALWRFHAAPPVFTYNAVLGYFPGNMYDEHVTLGEPLAWSRLEQLGWVVGVLALIATRFDVATYRLRWRAPRPAGRRWGAWLVALGALALAIGLRANGGPLGFAVDAEDLEDSLGGRIETAHFVIYYAQTPEIEKDIQLIAADHEFRYHQVVAQLGVEPAGKLVSFYFADPEQKGRLHGSRNVEMAKPWRHEIYLDHQSFPHASLRHEIAHAVAAEFGDDVWGVAVQRIGGLPVLFSPGLVEGLAVAVDWPGSYDRPTPDELVRVLQALGSEPSIQSLLGLSFFSVSAAKGYTTAGSFLRYLLDEYGPAKLRAVYRSGGDFEAAYGMPRGALEAGWKDKLAKLAIPKDMVEASRERFRQGSVFAKPCPHAIAKQVRRAEEAYATGEQARAIQLMRDVCRDAPGDPAYQIRLGNYLFGGDDVDKSEGQLLWWLVALDGKRVTSTLRAKAFENLAKAAAARGDFARARVLVEDGRRLPIDLGDRRQLDAMAFALDHQGPAGKPLRAYFFPPPDGNTVTLDEARAAVAAEPQLGFAHYLLAIQQQFRGNHADTAIEFARGLELGLPGPSFVKNAARRLAIAAYRANDRARLAIALSVLSGSDMTTGDHLLARDWLDRITFDDAQRR